jgi:molecular chaperone GrpE
MKFYIVKPKIKKNETDMSKKTSKTIDEKKRKTIVENNNNGGAEQVDKNALNEEQQNQDISAEEVMAEMEEAAQSSEITSELEKKFEELNFKASELQDKYLRLSAEFDNYRKRTLKEKSELIRIANEDLLKDVLPVVDDFERGISIIDKSQDLDALRTGIHLIYSKFSDFLKTEGLKEIDAKGKVFDLEFHEALTKIPAPDEELKGKVVRYAKVVVGE